ncbi:unnamed protein product [Caenorhabditis brenneri]
MSEDPVPSTLAPFIVRKLDALGSDPKKDDLEALNKLLNTVPPERVVSDEEVQELKSLEKKTLKNQEMFKKEMEDRKKRGKFSIFFCLSFPLPFILSLIIYFNYPEFELVADFIILLGFWPVKSVAIVILFYFYRFDLGLKLSTPKTVQPEEFENEDDDWQDTMTSTELHFRQKALVDGWEQLRKERNERLDLNFLLAFFALFINLLYSSIWADFIDDFKHQSDSLDILSFSIEPYSIFAFVEYIFSISMLLFFFIHNLVDGTIRRD